MPDEVGAFACGYHTFSFPRGGKKKSDVTKPTSPPKEEIPTPSQTPTSSQEVTPIVSKPAVIPPKSTEVARDTPSLFRRKKENTATKQEEQPKVATPNQEIVTAFSQEELSEVWKQFAEEKKSEDPSIQVILKKKLTKSENFEVVITLGSQLETSFLSKLELDIIQYLRKHLKNQKITLRKELKELEIVDKLYTRKDIYEQMIKDNPNLKDLKERLGLDYDI